MAYPPHGEEFPGSPDVPGLSLGLSMLMEDISSQAMSTLRSVSLVSWCYHGLYKQHPLCRCCDLMLTARCQADGDAGSHLGLARFLLLGQYSLFSARLPH